MLFLIFTVCRSIKAKINKMCLRVYSFENMVRCTKMIHFYWLHLADIRWCITGTSKWNCFHLFWKLSTEKYGSSHLKCHRSFRDYSLHVFLSDWRWRCLRISGSFLRIVFPMEFSATYVTLITIFMKSF